jgi:hypothetical protein
MPVFVDYLYLSLTNSSAFSPTDTMPLSTRAKALMSLEATAALLTSLLVIAKAVSSLGGQPAYPLHLLSNPSCRCGTWYWPELGHFPRREQ